MNQEMKAKWVAALRSGKYKQGRGYLRRIDDTFCCLGVACETFRPDLLNYDSDGWPQYENATYYLPTVLKKELEIDNDQQSELIKLNDNKKCSFEEIADFIEKNY